MITLNYYTVIISLFTANVFERNGTHWTSKSVLGVLQFITYGDIYMACGSDWELVLSSNSSLTVILDLLRRLHDGAFCTETHSMARFDLW